MGVTIGWGLAVVLVPFDEADGAIYSKIGAGVTTFLSGFVVGHIPGLVKEQMGARQRYFLVQVGLGVTALLITGLTVTINRTEYLAQAREGRAARTALEMNEQAKIANIRAEYADKYAALKQKEGD